MELRTYYYLDTAAALVVLTIYRDINAAILPTVLALVNFGLSLIFAVNGMVAVNTQLRLSPWAEGRRIEPSRFFRIYPAAHFVLGVLLFVYGYVFSLLCEAYIAAWACFPGT